MIKKVSKISVEQNPEAPVKKTILAQAIVDISKAMKALQDSGLNRHAIVVLLGSKNGMPPKYQIINVLDGLEQLARDFTK